MSREHGQQAARTAIRAGILRGWIETRQSLSGWGLLGHLMFPVIYAVVLLLMQGNTVPGTEFALGAMVLPSIIGMSIAFGGINAPAGSIVMDREDGTLLRAKATPNGMLGYLVGKLVMIFLMTLVGLVLMIIPASTVAADLVIDARSVLMLVVVITLGLAATVPLGVAMGSVVKSSAQNMVTFLSSMVIIGLSGIFYPITALPVWLQWVGQAFPFYWLGLGARAAMLPPELVVAELGQSWRTPEMIAVLGLWAVLGMVCAPVFLRRMARRQSGSAVARVRERYMAKGY